MHSTDRTRTRGFSLMELMIAVAVVGIIAAFAYPSYLDSVHRSGRGDARTVLNAAANSLEQFFATNRTYTTTLADLGLGTGLSPAGKYQITVAAGPSGDIASSYLITATPVAGEGQADDTDCPSFALNSAGQRIPAPASSSCW